MASGHRKNEILSEYTLDEVRLFYEKSIAKEMSGRADFIEGVMIGIGGAFGEKQSYERSIKPLLKQLRGD